MFTGLIREIASVKNYINNVLTIKANFKPKIGDSIAINGACLTVINIQSQFFSVELSPESSKLLAIENYKNEVHIEPAMVMGDRFEGHIVQGHVDCVGTVKSIQKLGNSVDFFIEIPNEFMKYVIDKGSITIDGVSLTINEVIDNKNQFRLTIIPHTVNNTLFRSYKINSKVNIETDMFARYAYNILKKKNGNLSWNEVDRVMNSY